MNLPKDLSQKLSDSLKKTELFESKYGSLALIHQKQLMVQRIQSSSPSLDLIRTINSARLALANPVEDMLRQLRPSIEMMRLHLDLGEKMNNAINAYRDELTKFQGISAYIQDFQKYCSLSLGKVFESQRVISELGQSLQKKISDLTLTIRFPHERVADAFAGIRALAEERECLIPSIDFAIHAVVGYQKFAERQLMRINKDSEDVKERRLIITDLAGDLFEISQGIWEMHGMQITEVDSESSQQPAFRVNIYPELNRQLAYVYRKDSKVDPCFAFDSSLSANISNVAGEIVELVFNINEISSRISGENIFKPTNKTIRACVVLSNTVARSEALFADVIDSLYFLLYEGSGYANRLTNFMTDPELQTLWWVKTLRTSFRHDIDHGERRKVRKKQQEIGEVFRQLVSKARPTSTFEWANTQMRLYEYIVNLLREIMDKLSSD